MWPPPTAVLICQPEKEREREREIYWVSFPPESSIYSLPLHLNCESQQQRNVLFSSGTPFLFTTDSELRGWGHNPVVPLFCMRTVLVCSRLKYGVK